MSLGKTRIDEKGDRDRRRGRDRTRPGASHGVGSEPAGLRAQNQAQRKRNMGLLLPAERKTACGVASTTLTLGRWPALGLDAARTAAMAHAARVAQGFDPAGYVRRAKTAERAGLAIAIADYAADMRRRRLVKADVAASALRRGFAPIIGMNVSALDRRTIVELIEGVARAEKRLGTERVHCTAGRSSTIPAGGANLSRTAGAARPDAIQCTRGIQVAQVVA